MFRFIADFLKATFGIIGMVVLFLLMCVFGYFIYWFLEFFFVGWVEAEWITNQYIVPVIMWVFEGEYSEIIEIIMVVGFSAMWFLGQSSKNS